MSEETLHQESKEWQIAKLAVASLEWSADSAQHGPALESVGGFGEYEGLPPRLELLDDGRKARLIAPLSYIAEDGLGWPVPDGTIVDGASIPRLFWSLIGGPFEGQYRNASIVHDRYCDTKERPWRDVHRMFYAAMRCSGVSLAKAKIMFYAVYRFGPRWPTPGAAGLEAMTQTLGPDRADPLTFVTDAQAILSIDPSLEEIEALADARAAEDRTPALEGVGESTSAERARRLVITGGQGTADDVAAVAKEAANLPDFVLGRFESQLIRIIACRSSVTDFEVGLRGVIPRGWEGTGKSWDDVPGTYFNDRKRVVIATIETGGQRTVPTRASRLHGSANLVVHESLHGYDYSGNHKVLSDTRFLTARTADYAKLGSYEQQAGQAGLEETFAETGARYVSELGVLRTDWPSLCSYWAGGVSRFATGAPAFEAPAGGPSPIGTAERLADGAIELDLRAEDPSGAIGHAILRIEPDDPHYEAVSGHVAKAGGLESSGGGPVPFFPMGE
jgi:hypothetical protein